MQDCSGSARMDSGRKLGCRPQTSLERATEALRPEFDQRRLRTTMRSTQKDGGTARNEGPVASLGRTSYPFRAISLPQMARITASSSRLSWLVQASLRSAAIPPAICSRSSGPSPEAASAAPTNRPISQHSRHGSATRSS